MNDDCNFKKYEPMFYSILKKYGLYSKRDDYIDLCYIGYSKAINNYNNKKSRLSTYIYKCIKNEILQELRKEKADKRQGIELSFDYVYDDKGHDFDDLIPDDIDLESELIERETSTQLCNALCSLTKNEQVIIKSLFQLDGFNKTQIELACEFNISQAQISRIKDKALEKMRGMVE